MAQIKKMLLQGIRSFDPEGESAQLIEFFSPMTLIVGQNGCGKTTIIEALKYSITGETPPNTTKGGSFVNDPKLGNGYEVKAHVKLELLDRMGDKLVVSRKLKASVKGKLGNVSMSTVEGTITRVAGSDGKKTTLQAKCIDMKDEMCRIMGVSEAILNNVIFCHQEDSCWPLDEASKVKQKFDAIFNTTMYIKALKSLQDTEKEAGQKVRELNIQLGHCAQDLKMANRKKAQLEDNKTDLKSLTDLIASANRDCTELETEERTYEKLRAEYTMISTEVATKRTRISDLTDSIENLHKKITEPFEGDLNELKQAIEKFDYHQQMKEKVLTGLNRDLKAKLSEQQSLNNTKSKCLKEEGAFRGAEAGNLRRIEEMRSILNKFASFCKVMKENSQDDDFPIGLDTVLMSFEQDVDSVEAGTAIKAISSAIQVKKREFDKIKIEYDSKEKEFQTRIDSLKEIATKLSTELQLKEKHEKANSIKIAEFGRQLRNLEGSTEALEELDLEQAKWTSSIENIEKGGIIPKYDNEIKSLKAELLELEKKKKIASDQHFLLSRDFSAVQQISGLDASKNRKRMDCIDIMRRIEPELKNVMDVVPQDNLGAALSSKMESFKADMSTVNDKIKKLERDITQTEMEIKQANKEMAKKEQELKAWKQKVNRLLEGDSFEEEYTNALELVKSLEQELSLSDAVKFLYSSYIKQLNKRPCCPLCKRDFERHTEKESVIQELTTKVETQNKDAQAEELRKLKHKADSLADLKPNWADKAKLETVEIPSLKEKKTALEEKLRTLRSTLDDLNDQLAALSGDATIVQNIVGDANVLDQNRKDIKKFESDIRKLEETRNPEAAELTKTLTDVEIELENLTGTVAAKTLEKETKENSRSAKINALNQAQQKLNNVQSERNRITSDLQNREGVENQKKSLEEENVGLKAAIQEINKKVPNSKRDIQSAERSKTDMVSKKEERLKQLNNEASKLELQQSTLKSLYTSIEAFQATKANYVEQEKKLLDCTAKLSACEAQIAELRNESEIINTEILTQTNKKRELDDTMDIRNQEAEIVMLVEQIKENEKAIDETKVHGVNRQLKEIRNKIESLSAKKNQNKGQISKTRVTIQELTDELSTSPFVNAEEEHRKKLVQKFIHEKAFKDIRVYRTALDHAVMTFHHKKMEAINKHLKLYWQRIYKGNDIDFIMIKTDNEDPNTSGGSTTVKLDMSKTQRKIYNYRVVMNRRGIELDMRGRCSAGQKVLASIIIRIALSQTFGTQCGIITLDEPTTNLDKPNIESLAEMLSDLSVSMRGNKTFQLVVITHDQDFIDRLVRADPAEHYFRVSRNQMGYSRIERIAIT